MSAPSCAPGTSQPIPGLQTTFYLTGGTLALLASALGLTWLAEVFGFVGGLSFNLTDICNVDPPADPGLTAADIYCALNPFFNVCDQASALAKLTNLLVRFAWFQWCECVGASTPAAPTVPSAPSGTPTINPVTIIGNQTSTQCFDSGTSLPIGPVTAAVNYGTWQLPGIPVPYTQYFSGGIDQPASPLPNPTPLSAQFTLHVNNEGAHAGTYSLDIIDVTTTTFGTIAAGQINLAAVNSTTTTAIFALSPNTVALAWQMSPGNVGTQTNTFTLDVKFFCNGNAIGGNNTLGCCPPDPNLMAAIADIQQLVTFVQRYLVPFAFVSGTSHAGLTGTSNVGVAQLIGLLVTVTAYPANPRTSPGNPTYYFDLGWISLSETGGMILEHRVSQLEFYWFPKEAQLADHVNWFLNPGVTITIQELYAES